MYVCMHVCEQEVGREEQALEVLGEAIDEWRSAQSDVPDSRPSDGGHELFLDRGVLRLATCLPGVRMWLLSKRGEGAQGHGAKCHRGGEGTMSQEISEDPNLRSSLLYLTQKLFSFCRKQRHT